MVGKYNNINSSNIDSNSVLHFTDTILLDKQSVDSSLTNLSLSQVLNLLNTSSCEGVMLYNGNRIIFVIAKNLALDLDTKNWIGWIDSDSLYYSVYDMDLNTYTDFTEFTDDIQLQYLDSYFITKFDNTKKYVKYLNTYTSEFTGWVSVEFINKYYTVKYKQLLGGE